MQALTIESTTRIRPPSTLTLRLCHCQSIHAHRACAPLPRRVLHLLGLLEATSTIAINIRAGTDHAMITLLRFPPSQKDRRVPPISQERHVPTPSEAHLGQAHRVLDGHPLHLERASQVDSSRYADPPSAPYRTSAQCTEPPRRRPDGRRVDHSHRARKSAPPYRAHPLRRRAHRNRRCQPCRRTFPAHPSPDDDRARKQGHRSNPGHRYRTGSVH